MSDWDDIPWDSRVTKLGMYLAPEGMTVTNPKVGFAGWEEKVAAILLFLCYERKLISKSTMYDLNVEITGDIRHRDTIENLRFTHFDDENSFFWDIADALQEAPDEAQWLREYFAQNEELHKPELILLHVTYNGETDSSNFPELLREYMKPIRKSRKVAPKPPKKA